MFLSFIKECPKCHVTIEKNGGCNHMVCRNSSCKVRFIWYFIFSCLLFCFCLVSLPDFHLLNVSCASTSFIGSKPLQLIVPSVSGDTCDRTCACLHKCKVPSMSGKSPVPRSLNRNRTCHIGISLSQLQR